MGIEAVCNAAESTGIQGSSIKAVRCPSACHSTCVTCGMMGDSPSTTISNASCITLRSCGEFCREPWDAFASAFNSSIAAAIAVLKVRRRPISSVIFARVWCAWRRIVRCCFAEGSLVEGGRSTLLHVVMDRLPKAFDESRGALHTLVRPLERLLRRRGEHGEQTRRVGAEFVHQGLRVDAVLLGLRHGHDAARFDLLSVGTQHGDSPLRSRIQGHFHIGRTEVLDAARLRFA